MNKETYYQLKKTKTLKYGEFSEISFIVVPKNQLKNIDKRTNQLFSVIKRGKNESHTISNYADKNCSLRHINFCGNKQFTKSAQFNCGNVIFFLISYSVNSLNECIMRIELDP
jgi:hypothetical protein